jgi:hypothetical protein
MEENIYYNFENEFKESNLEEGIKKLSLHHSLIPISEQGVQGHVFKCNLNCKEFIVKISKNIDFTLELENEAWKRLSNFNSPHFCKIYVFIPLKKGGKNYCIFFDSIQVHPSGGKYKKNCEKLFIEMKEKNVFQNKSFSSLLNDPYLHPSALLNCVRQTLAAISIYEKVGITHYDLHLENVMISSTSYDFHIYQFDKIFIPIMTFGICPVIIDFGLSHISNFKWAATSAFMKNNITTFCNDPLIDCLFFLSQVSRNLVIHSRWKNIFPRETKELNRFVRNIKIMFSKLNTDSSGWFKKEYFSNLFFDIIKKIPKISCGIFHRSNIEYVIEMLQFSLTLPISEKKQTNLSFQKAILKLAIIWIENVSPIIRNTKEEQFFFKDIIISIVEDNCISKCSGECFQIIKLKHRYSKILNINKIRNAVKKTSNAMNNELFDLIPEIIKQKKEIYKNQVLKSTLDILPKIPKIDYKFEEGMKIFVQRLNKNVSSQFSFTITKEMFEKLKKDKNLIENIVNSFS